jgi:DNA uptake protein ComE-like DNA-binding protein
MKSGTAFLIGIGTGVGLFVVAALRLHRKRHPFEIRSENLHYQEHSFAELAAEHLLDLNTATHDQLANLGMSNDASERIVENRPYRNKLELVSRMVIPEQTYESIKDHIGVARASESTKVAL